MADPTTKPADDKKKKNIFSRIVDWFKSTANWIEDHLTDSAIATSIRTDLGLKPGAAIPAAQAGKFAQYGAGLDPDKEALSESIAQVSAIIPDLKALATSFETDDVPANQILYTIMALAATDSIRLRLPSVFAFARLGMFVEGDPESLIVLDPAKLLRNVRGEDLPSGEALLERISNGGALLLEILAMVFDKNADPEKHGTFDIVAGWDPQPETQTPKNDLVSLRTTTIAIGKDSGTAGSLLITLAAVPREHGGPGLFIAFGGALSVKRETDTLKFNFDAGFPAAFDLFIPFADDAKLGFTANGGGTNPFLNFTIDRGNPTEPAFRIGEPTGTRLDIYQTQFGISVTPQSAGVHAALSDAELVIAGGEGGSFLSELLGNGAKVRFSGGFTADGDGFRLDGGTNLHATLPVGKSIAGVLTVQNVELGLGPSANGGELGLELSGGFSTKIAGFQAVIDRVGFQLNIEKSDNGNFGPFNLSLGFKAPNGIGLSLNSGLVTGGGYLYVDPVNHEYAGALELKFGRLSIKAIGVLSEANEGWSLILMLFGQLAPAQPSPGWTLYGVGGIIGVQRGVDETQLAQALKTKAFDDILFPDNPVADAPRIISELRTFFPYSAHSLTIGPMVDIGYGSPRFLYIRVALIFQINNVFHSSDDWALARIVLVGQLRLELGPTKTDTSKTVVKLIVDVLGFWDIDQKKYGFLAALRDSKIATIDVTGGLIVYGDYGENEQFILAAGGFNPRFTDVPPEAKAAVDRIGASFKVGRFSMKMNGYFALTPGTIQAGFDFQASASIGPVGLKGELGLDVIVYRDPHTHFIADFKFSAAITYSGHSLAGVNISGTIKGPGAWEVSGKVSFSILFWDISKSFDEHFGSGDDAALVATNVQTLLQAELTRAGNWTSALPPASEALVTLAPQTGDTATVAHPFAKLSFTQTVVPFGLTLDKFGDTTISGPNHFDITKVTVGGTKVDAPNFAQEHFARAQFLQMSDEDKLSKPSFEPMIAGVDFSTSDYHLSASSLSFAMEYEMIYLDTDPVRPNVTRPDKSLVSLRLNHDHVAALATQGAAARSTRRLDEQMLGKTANRINLSAPPLAVATVDTMSPDGVTLTGQATDVKMVAEQKLTPADRLKAQLVEQFELAHW